jgi:parallel beta-helix repeat protein
MTILRIAILLLILLPVRNTAQERAPVKEMLITSSTRLPGGVFELSGQDKMPVITISGKDIILDGNHTFLSGSPGIDRPDEYTGIAIRILPGSKNITIRNLNIRGYKIAIRADSVDALRIENCNLSFNYRQQLKSDLLREDISDWMSFHHNENDEWARYGAAIYLRKCHNARIQENIVNNGQCAVMLTQSDSAVIANNDLSFNSGVGIGLYRSSWNKIYHNRLDWNVRGYSHGRYKRGQDSAGILVFEQSSENIFAYNSATHSGDGFFLWAGQSTMDSGKGGSNDNLIIGNDFSYAPTNGIELTFSRNLVIRNIIRDCDHGIWGGYSYGSDITDNEFAFNRIGIAIEHGQDINIALNRFLYDQTAIKLWSRESQPADWGYAQQRNTASRNYWIAANQFTAVNLVYDIMGTDTVALSGNMKMANQRLFKIGDRVNELDSVHENDPLGMDYDPDPRLQKIPVRKRPEVPFLKGKEQIRITQWGPYNFQYPLLWLRDIDSSGLHYFEVLGKTGSWKIDQLTDFEIVQQGPDTFPSYLTAKKLSKTIEPSIQLQYQGPDFTDIHGKPGKTGDHFGYQIFSPNYQWQTQWFNWKEAPDPIQDSSRFLLWLNKATPLHSDTLSQLDFTWWNQPAETVPADSFATVANTSVTLPTGTYSLGITADDLVKVWINDQLVINAWNERFAQLDENTHHRTKLYLPAGTHRIKVIQVDKAGLATLNFYLRKE